MGPFSRCCPPTFMRCPFSSTLSCSRSSIICGVENQLRKTDEEMA